MKPVKFTLLASLATFLLIAAFANAQTSMSKPNDTMSKTNGTMSKSMETMAKPMESDSMRIEHHVAMMKENLNLTDAQATQIRGIYENQDKQMMADHQKYATDANALKKARTELRTSTDKEISGVLNKDQLKKYQEMEKKEMSKGWHKTDQSTTTNKGTTQYKAK